MKSRINIDEIVYNFLHSQCDFAEEILLTNFFHGDWEADILRIGRDGFSHEIEIKLSKPDFRNDFKKFYTNQKTGEKFLKHDKICCGDFVCNRFSFLLPMGMVPHSEIPEHCGIIEFYHNPDSWKTEFFNVREAKLLHEDPYWKLVDKDLFIRKLAQNLLAKKLELKGRAEELILPNPSELKRK